MPFLDDIALKQRFLNGEAVGERMLTQLIGMSTMTRQPLDFIEKVMQEVDNFSKTRDFDWQNYKLPAESSDPIMLNKVREVTNQLLASQDQALNGRINRIMFSDFKSYKKKIEDEITRKRFELNVKLKGNPQPEKGKGKHTEEYAFVRECTVIARRLNMMSSFQMQIEDLRRDLKLVPKFPKSLTELNCQSPRDLLYEYLRSNNEDLNTVLPEAYKRVQVICVNLGLDQMDHLSLVIALLCFGPRNIDLTTDSAKLEMLLYMATQRVISGLDKVKVDLDNTGLVAGLLLALAHTSQFVEHADQLPKEVQAWILLGTKLCKVIGVTPESTRPFIEALTKVGGNLYDLRIPEPRLQVEIDNEMSETEYRRAWRGAHTVRHMLRAESKKYNRAVAKWTSFDNDIAFWEYYESAEGKTAANRLDKALEAYNRDRKKRGLPALFDPANKIPMREYAKSIVVRVRKIRAAITIR